jgi:CHAD domain-containing protein
VAKSSSQGLHDTLAAGIKDRCRQYRKALKRCRKLFSEESVHQLRVETRRLLAMLDILELLFHAPCLTEVRQHLRKLFKNSARLRDTQVQQQFLREKQDDFPELAPLIQALVRREKRLMRRLKRKIQERALPELDRSMAALKKDVRRLMAEGRIEERHWTVIWGGIDRAFRHAVELRRQLRAENPAAIHRLRIAFKKFRYRVESLAPLLPRMSARRLQAMHAYQTQMGEIQDAETLRRALDKLEKKADVLPVRFREALTIHEADLIGAFLETADRLLAYWPVKTMVGKRQRITLP